MSDSQKEIVPQLHR